MKRTNKKELFTKSYKYFYARSKSTSARTTRCCHLELDLCKWD
jgi:hypothetical protein